MPSGGRAAWGRPTDLRIHVGYALPPQFLSSLFNGDGKKDPSAPFGKGREVEGRSSFESIPFPSPYTLGKNKNKNREIFSVSVPCLLSRRRVFRGDFMMEWKK